MTPVERAFEAGWANRPSQLGSFDALHMAFVSVHARNLYEKAEETLVKVLTYGITRDTAAWNSNLDFARSVRQERTRQQSKWKEDHKHTPYDWLRIINSYINAPNIHPRKQCVIVAALLVAVIESRSEKPSYPQQVDDIVRNSNPPQEYIDEVNDSYDGPNRSGDCDPYENWVGMTAQQRGEIAYRIVQNRYKETQRVPTQVNRFHAAAKEEAAASLRSTESHISSLRDRAGNIIGWYIPRVTGQATDERGTASQHPFKRVEFPLGQRIAGNSAAWQRESRQAQNPTPVQGVSAHVTPVVRPQTEPVVAADFAGIEAKAPPLWQSGEKPQTGTLDPNLTLAHIRGNIVSDGRTNLPMTVQDLASAISALSQAELATKTVPELAHQFGVTEELMVEAAKIAFGTPDDVELIADKIREMENAESLSAFGIAQALNIPVDMAQKARERVFPKS